MAWGNGLGLRRQLDFVWNESECVIRLELIKKMLLYMQGPGHIEVECSLGVINTQWGSRMTGMYSRGSGITV